MQRRPVWQTVWPASPRCPTSGCSVSGRGRPSRHVLGRDTLKLSAGPPFQTSQTCRTLGNCSCPYNWCPVRWVLDLGVSLAGYWNFANYCTLHVHQTCSVDSIWLGPITMDGTFCATAMPAQRTVPRGCWRARPRTPLVSSILAVSRTTMRGPKLKEAGLAFPFKSAPLTPRLPRPM